MTREEAIAYYKKNAIRIKGIMAEEDEALKDRFFQTLEALEMAIKALEQEPCEDVISRQAVLDVVNNPLNIRLDEIIKKLPPVNPQERTGHWIRMNDDMVKCSECGRYLYKVDEEDLVEFHAWCGRCGARMESEVTK